MCLSKIRRRGKAFLSKSHDEGGTVTWNVSARKGDYEDPLISTLRITDCEKAIYIDFDCHKVKYIQGRIEKLDVLLEEINKFREALLEVQEFHKPKKLYY